MATKKKYSNNVDSGARHHYDVYELMGNEAFHIAPFSQEMEAFRVAEALAALDVLDSGVDTGSKYVVRARPTTAHNIHKRDARGVKRTYDNMTRAREGLAKLFAETDNFWKEPLEGSGEVPAGIITEDKPKKRLIKRKPKSAKATA